MKTRWRIFESKLVCGHSVLQFAWNIYLSNSDVIFVDFSAVKKGTNMLEMDVRLTKDGQVVVFHDATLLRVTGQDLNISQVDYASLPKLSARVPIDTIPGTKLLIIVSNC